MEGMIEVTYTILCSSDTNKEVELKEILANEKILKLLKSEFVKGIRNIELLAKEESSVVFRTQKEHFIFRVSKNDFADIVELAEEDAKKHKRLKKGCDGIEIVNIVTID